MAVQVQMELNIFSKNVLSPDNICQHCFQVDEVKTRTMYLAALTVPIPSEIPHYFNAIQASFSEEQKIRVYCSDHKRLNQILMQCQANFSGFIILVGNHDEAAVVVSYEDDCICFNWHENNIIAKHAGSHIG